MGGTGQCWGWSRRRRTNASLTTRFLFSPTCSVLIILYGEASWQNQIFQSPHPDCWCHRYWKLARAWLACNMEPTRVPPRYNYIGENELRTNFDLSQAGMTPYGASRQIRPEGGSLHCRLTQLCFWRLNYRHYQEVLIASQWFELERRVFKREDGAHYMYTKPALCCICWWSFHFIAGSQQARLLPSCNVIYHLLPLLPPWPPAPKPS